MGRVLTNNVGLAYSIESSLGTASTAWEILEPNTIGTYGATIGKVERDPISPTRQRRKGATVDLDSAVDFQHDLTLSGLRDFAEAFCFAVAKNSDVTGLVATAATNSSGEYTLSSALVSGQIDRFVTDTDGHSLIWASGFSDAANNGLKEITTDATASTALAVSDTLADESGASGRISFAGHRVADGVSVTWTWSSGNKQGTLAATGLGTLLAALDLTAGQLVHFGSIASAGGAIQNAWDDVGTNDAYGYARVVSIAADSIVFDKVDTLLQTSLSDPGELDILFAEFVRNVATSSSEYLERSFHFEATMPGLGTGAVGNTDDSYQYAKGNLANELAFNLPLTDKATMQLGFIGTDTDNPTTTRRSGADSATTPAQTAPFNTSADIVRLRIQEADEDGLTTDFRDVTLTLRNNVSPEKVLGVLGARFMNTGNFEVDLDATLVFTNPLVIDKIRDNETVTMDFVVKNDDGVIAIDLPSMTLGGGGLDLARDESVRISTTGQAFGDPTLNTSIGISLFPVPLP